MAKQVERLRDLGSGRRDAIMMDPKIILIEKALQSAADYSPEREPRSPRRTEGQHQSARRASAATCTLRRAATVRRAVTANVGSGPCLNLSRKA